MGVPDLETKLKRITDCGSDSIGHDISGSLLHAYTACLSIEELAEAVVRTIDEQIKIRSAVRNRLAKVCGEEINQSQIDQLGERIVALTPSDAKTKVRIDALLSYLYGYFNPSIRQEILNRWRSRGTRSAGARWLKALSDDELLFSIDDVLAYWRVTSDWRAAKVLAYRADSTLLTEILPDLIGVCDEGWIVSRAALHAESVSEECWERIRAKFPASYAYLCAKMSRSLGEEEALQLVIEAGRTWPSDQRGLVIWAIGQLGMWSVLDTIREMAPELRNADLARIGLVLSEQAQQTPTQASDS